MMSLHGMSDFNAFGCVILMHGDYVLFDLIDFLMSLHGIS